jgi:hypothetical protein
MCFRIDSPRAARHNNHASIRAGSCKSTSLPEPHATAPTRTNNGNRWGGEHAALTSHAKQCWWVGNTHHLWWESIIIKWQEHATDPIEPFNLIDGNTSSNRRAYRLASRAGHIWRPIDARTTIGSSHNRVNISEVL